MDSLFLLPATEYNYSCNRFSGKWISKKNKKKIINKKIKNKEIKKYINKERSLNVLCQDCREERNSQQNIPYPNF